MFEPRHVRPLPPAAFRRRLAFHGFAALTVMLLCLLVGMVGYHFLEQLNWIDAYANASMILSGMGPLDQLKTNGGKVFAGTYALFSGVAFLTTVGFFLAPIAHRVLHKFHFDSKSDR
jgi:hypothetical protein